MPNALPAATRRRTAWVLLGCFVCQLGLGFSYLFGPLLKAVTDDLGWSREEFAGARTTYFFVIALASPVVGSLAVRFGARRVLVGAAVGLALAFGWLSRMTALWELYAANVIWGLVMVGLGDVVVSAVVMGWLARGRGLALGFVYAASNLGGALVAPAFAALAARSSWREALLALAGAGVALILPFAAFAVRDPAPRDAAAGAGEGAAETPALTLSEALRTRSFWLLLFALGAYFFYFLGINDSLVASLEDGGMSASDAARYYAYATGAGWLAKLVFGAIAEWLPVRAAMLLDYALLALSAALLLFLPSEPVFFCFLASYGFAVAARDVVYPLLVAHVFGQRTMPQLYGTLMASLAVAGPAGSWFAQRVHTATGSYDGAHRSFALLMLAVLASLLFVRREAGATTRTTGRMPASSPSIPGSA